jgi:hypothetical protein
VQHLLIAAAVLLGVFHTFIMKAVTQYKRDASQLHTPLEDAKLADNESGMSKEEYNEAISKIFSSSRVVHRPLPLDDVS